jgi:hypothetical protein
LGSEKLTGLSAAGTRPRRFPWILSDYDLVSVGIEDPLSSNRTLDLLERDDIRIEAIEIFSEETVVLALPGKTTPSVLFREGPEIPTSDRQLLRVYLGRECQEEHAAKEKTRKAHEAQPSNKSKDTSTNDTSGISIVNFLRKLASYAGRAPPTPAPGLA